MKPATTAVRAGIGTDTQHGAVVPPLYLSATRARQASTEGSAASAAENNQASMGTQEGRVCTVVKVCRHTKPTAMTP